MSFSTMIVRVISLGLLFAAASSVFAQQSNAYPTRPVRYIIPYPPGGSTDPQGRMIATKLTEMWGALGGCGQSAGWQHRHRHRGSGSCRA